MRMGDLRLTDEVWNRLGIPVGLAYLVRDTSSGRVLAWYPGPAGAIEAEVDTGCWEELLRQNPVVRTLEPDVEALLVNRVRGARAYFLVPIDDCYGLVGLIRSRWHGLTGGSEVWEHVSTYFEQLSRRSRGEAADPVP